MNALIRLRKEVSREPSAFDEETTVYEYETYKHDTIWYDGMEQALENNFDEYFALYAQKESDDIANKVREHRNKLLTATDYLMAFDYPLAEEAREQWREYRQALRDISNQAGFPYSIDWPIKPKETDIGSVLSITTQNTVSELSALVALLSNRISALESGTSYVPDEWPEWYRWGGVGDIPWQKDSQCIHEGVKYVSCVDNNIWEPNAISVIGKFWNVAEE